MLIILKIFLNYSKVYHLLKKFSLLKCLHIFMVIYITDLYSHIKRTQVFQNVFFFLEHVGNFLNSL